VRPSPAIHRARAAAAALGAALLSACAAGGPAAAPAAAAPPKKLFEPRPDAEVAAVKDPHAFQGEPLCQRCHEPSGPLVADPVALCRQCHRFGHGNHPVDVVQAGDAKGLPLLAGGRLACHTCHDPHRVTPRSGLRKPFDDLCKTCHRGH
jgi:predicted CXXCH cytochrome family protein